jgi:hypothetical protein
VVEEEEEEEEREGVEQKAEERSIQRADRPTTNAYDRM